MSRKRPDETSGSDLTLEPADDADLERVEALLGAEGLPSADVRGGPARFFLASLDDEFVGIGGLEIHGRAGLLRSVVVDETARGEGHGAELCAALEARARAAGVETLYLLTTTAAGFFRRCGYEAIPREAVPPAIAGTAEFDELCPDDATCMRTALG